MNRLRGWQAWLLCGFVGSALLIAPQRAYAIYNIKVGDPIPEFDLPKVEEPSESVHSQALQGKPLAIVFWRPEQSLSLEALREMGRVIEEIGAGKLNAIGVTVSLNSDVDLGATFGDEPLSYPVLFDPDRALYGKVGVIVAPTTLIVDAEGRLRFVIPSLTGQYRRAALARFRFLLGEIDEEEMERQISPAVLKIERDQAKAWRRYNLGRKLEENGKTDDAIRMYEQAIEDYPQLVQAQCSLGFLKIANGEIRSAADHFKVALKYQSDFPEAKLGQAVVLVRLKQFDEAEGILLPLRKEKSVAARAYYELGLLYRARGEEEKALEAYEEALRTTYPEKGNEKL